MKNNIFKAIALVAATQTLSGCEVIGGIFKTGVGVGIFIVVLIIVVVFIVMARGSKK